MKVAFCKNDFHINFSEILKKYVKVVFCKDDLLKVVFSKVDFQLSQGDKTWSRQHIINAKAIKTCL